MAPQQASKGKKPPISHIRVNGLLLGTVVISEVGFSSTIDLAGYEDNVTCTIYDYCVDENLGKAIEWSYKERFKKEFRGGMNIYILWSENLGDGNELDNPNGWTSSKAKHLAGLVTDLANGRNLEADRQKELAKRRKENELRYSARMRSRSR